MDCLVLKYTCRFRHIKDLSSVFPRCTLPDVLSAAERRGTPVLLSASVSDNSGNSPQMSALKRSREIDQSMQRFHVGCDNRCGYKSWHPFDPG